MNYYAYTIATEEGLRDILLALFSVHPFNTFEETDTGFTAYIPEKDHDDTLIGDIQALQDQFSFSFEKSFIPYKNWNAEWEANFKPIQIGDFCGIRASFHEPMKVEHEIVIDPEMAFGTGHHETTYMMVQMMREMDFNHKKILDYGTGTGILAILAEKLGAAHLDAVDIEAPAYHNTIQNAAINNCKKINAIHGMLQDVPAGIYDTILANINRNVILESLEALYHKLPKGGYLLVSGFLLQDEDLLLQNSVAEGFQLIRRMERGKWLCILFQK